VAVVPLVVVEQVALKRVAVEREAVLLKTPTVLLRPLQVHGARGTRSRPVLTGFPARDKDAMSESREAKHPLIY
jgi:hypothetical protein